MIVDLAPPHLYASKQPSAEEESLRERIVGRAREYGCYGFGGLLRCCIRKGGQ